MLEDVILIIIGILSKLLNNLINYPHLSERLNFTINTKSTKNHNIFFNQ